MTRQTSNLPSPPDWLVEWIRDASSHGQCHSLVLSSGGEAGLDLREVSAAVAQYLNEFDGDGGCQWRTFDSELLAQLAGNPAARDLVLAGSASLTNRIAARPDLDRVIRRLARLGGVVLVGPAVLDATTDLAETFHICISSERPADHRNFHMWVNPHRFCQASLVNVIADSFLNWSSRASALSPSIDSRLGTPEWGAGPDLPH